MDPNELLGALTLLPSTYRLVMPTTGQVLRNVANCEEGWFNPFRHRFQLSPDCTALEHNQNAIPPRIIGKEVDIH